MKTTIWPAADDTALAAAAAVIKKGGLVAFPTETVYGLGADGLSGQAIKGVFRAKGRPQDNPLILHICDKTMLNKLVKTIPPAAEKLMQAFWPGPLTLVLEKTPAVPDEVTAGLSTVAVRMPDNAVALGLIRLSGLPLAAPSANLSGRPSPTDAEAVREDLDGLIDGVIDGGATKVGLESTVVDCTRTMPVVLRPGGVTLEQLAAAVGEVRIAGALEGHTPRAPGMKYRHYAPRAPLYLFPEGLKGDLADILPAAAARGRKIGVIARAVRPGEMADGGFVRLWMKEEELARGLYNWLRELDRKGAQIILVEKVKEKGLGEAIMNRMDKAAEGKMLATAGDMIALLQ